MRRDSCRRNGTIQIFWGQRVSDDEDVSIPFVPTPKHFTIEELFAGAREILIEHNGEIYRLRITAKGGLILTK